MFGLSDNEKLLKAAEKGDLSAVKNWIEREFADINAERDNGKPTPLYVALANNHMDVVDYLSARQDTLWPSLQAAIKENNLEAVKYFIENGKIDVNYPVGVAVSPAPLHLAVEYNHIGIVKYLIENGANMLKLYEKYPWYNEECPFIITPYSLAENVSRKKIYNMMKQYLQDPKTENGVYNQSAVQSAKKMKTDNKIEQLSPKETVQERRQQALDIVKQLNKATNEIKKLAMVGALCQILEAGDYQEAKSLYEEIEPKVDKMYHKSLQNVVRERR